MSAEGVPVVLPPLYVVVHDNRPYFDHDAVCLDMREAEVVMCSPRERIVKYIPASTADARVAQIRAEVIEECAKVCEARAAKHHGTFTEDLGESYELGWREDEGKDCANAILALAAKSGGERA